MTNKNFKFMFFTYFVIFGILVAFFGSFVGYNMNLIDIKKNIDKASQEVGLIKKFDYLKPDIEKFDEIVKALSTNTSLEEYITSPDKQKRNNLTNVFYAISMSNNFIMQARFISEEGKEIIRVDRKNKYDKPFIVEESSLQDKSQRDYFQIVSHMKEAKIWHSRIDLNIENGKIEVPYKPTFRVAQPIIKDNKFVGMVIVNLLASEMISGLKKSTSFDHFIIDKDGYFITHPNDDFSWSRYTNSSIRLYDEFPLEAEKILAGENKGETFYSFQLNDILDNEDKAILILKPKIAYQSTLFSSNIKTSILIILLSILVSIPLAFFASIAPSKLQKSLLLANQELRKFADIIDNYVITATTKTNSVITSVSTAFAKRYGYSKKELIGQKMNIIRHSETSNNLYSELWETIEAGKNWQGELKNLSKDGNTYYLEQNIIPMKDENNRIISYMAIGNDITAKKEVERLSEIDKLTGIYNRRKLDEYMESELNRAKRYHQPLSFMILDIDHFKNINDTYGHPVGDSTLQTLAKILTDNLRKSDILGRYGGEEFLIICPETDNNQTALLAEKLRACVENTLFNDIKNMTISIGVAEFEGENTVKELFSRADKALYQAKHNGRNRVVVG
ncbi:MAG TPA: diguanylate cyclase [Sulfurospirillum cavolei]|uniref:diguanylate cyclase n=1 Tax=Sulfurospirillum cavolei TaxID=366522 RepID=A0A2D3WAQ5_9BACT|nr:MAG TPA: diguanylate cyclase [Sulfurospirillum cavolei]